MALRDTARAPSLDLECGLLQSIATKNGATRCPRSRRFVISRCRVGSDLESHDRGHDMQSWYLHTGIHAGVASGSDRHAQSQSDLSRVRRVSSIPTHRVWCAPPSRSTLQCAFEVSESAAVTTDFDTGLITTGKGLFITDAAVHSSQGKQMRSMHWP